MPSVFQDTRMYEVAMNRETSLSLSEDSQQLAVDGTNPWAVLLPRHGRFVLVAAGNHEDVLVNGRRTKIKLLRHGDMIHLGAGNPIYFYDPPGSCPLCGHAL